LEEIRVKMQFPGQIAIYVSLFCFTFKEGSLYLSAQNRMATETYSEDIDYREAIKKQAMLAAIIDSSEDAIISKTLEGMITSWNQAARRMFGYEEPEAIGRHISLLIPQDRLQEEDLIIDRVRRGLNVQHFETIRQTKDGRLIPISLTVSPIKAVDGTIIGASKIARDISEQVKAREEIKMLNARKDEFIGIAGHELRTPITTIKGYLQLLEEEAETTVARNFLGKALRQVNKLNRLVGDLLDVSRIQAGQLQYNMVACRLLPLIREAVETIRQIYPGHSIDMILPAEDPVITADGAKIEQVLINFLTNAVKYSPDEAKVVVNVKISEGKAIVSVQDFGIGISSQHLDDIFSRYFRVDPSTSTGGLGLGLYISKEIILRHDGDIRVESKIGEGSVFYFSLPLPE
jgi:PAS domain S-box-containing protein